MKVANSFVFIASYPDSLLSFRGELMKDLILKGYSVHVIAPGISAKKTLCDSLTQKGIDFHEIPLSRTGLNIKQDLRSLIVIFMLLCKIKPKCVLAYTAKPVIYGMIAAFLSRVPYRFALITGLGYAFSDEGNNKTQRLIQWMYRVSLYFSSKVFFQNKDDEFLFRNKSILKPKTHSAVINGSGVDIYDYIVKPYPSKLTFLLIGRLLGAKGIREYVAAAKRIRTNYPDISFVLVGWIDEGPDSLKQEELLQWIEENIIDYRGRLDNVRPAIAESSVYVLPSYREGTPRSVLEAMSMGRAIITTDAPGCRETVINGENGFLVKVKCVDSLVDAMTIFIKNPSLIKTMGSRSRDIAEKKYHTRIVNAHMIREMGVT